jgi:transposase
MQRYIGLDVHSQTTAVASVNESGRRLGSRIVETSARTLVEAVQAVPRPRWLIMEEGTQSAWLAEVLGPHVEEVVVTVPPQRTVQAKNDLEDAYALAEKLRVGGVRQRVFKSPVTPLRHALALYEPLNKDVVRAKNRFRAILRSRGLRPLAENPYEPTPEELHATLKNLPQGMHFTAEAMLEQVYLLEDLRSRAEDVLVGEAKKHSAFRKLLTAPGFGPIRVATVLAIVVTPERFRQSHQFWSYCGLAVETTVSAEYRMHGKQVRRQRIPMTRGLKHGNPLLKNVFKGAALTVTTKMADRPLGLHYRQLLAHGTKENLARVTIARKLAAIVLAMWKTNQEYDPTKHHIHQE